MPKRSAPVDKESGEKENAKSEKMPRKSIDPRRSRETSGDSSNPLQNEADNQNQPSTSSEMSKSKSIGLKRMRMSIQDKFSNHDLLALTTTSMKRSRSSKFSFFIITSEIFCSGSFDSPAMLSMASGGKKSPNEIACLFKYLEKRPEYYVKHSDKNVRTHLNFLFLN